MASGQGRGSMSLSMKLIRLLIVLFNLAFIIVGLTLLAIGIYMIKDPKMQQLRQLLNPDLTSQYSQGLSYIELFAIVIIVIGGVCLVIGFLGCCGAIKGFRFLHVIYAIVIGIIILAEIGIVIYYVANQDRFKSQFVTTLQQAVRNQYVGPSIDNSTTNPFSVAFDFTQFNLQCCGAANMSDYQNTTRWSKSNPYGNGTLLVPFTCCPLGAGTNWNQLPSNMSIAQTCALTGQNAYTEGCYDALAALLATYKRNIIIGGAIIGVVEVVALLFALLLYCRKSDYSTL